MFSFFLLRVTACYNVKAFLHTGLKHWGYAGEEDFSEQTKPYWYTKKPRALAVETTAYALLTQLTLNDVTASNPIVAWLLQQREEHGSFVSTQVWEGRGRGGSVCLALSFSFSIFLWHSLFLWTSSKQTSKRPANILDFVLLAVSLFLCST